MIERIEIHNFRCFEKMILSGLGRVNLITGQNNAGKTALLEALYLSHTPTPQGIVNLLNLRGEPPQRLKAMPEMAWDNFFYNQDKSRPAKITVEGQEQTWCLELSHSSKPPRWKEGVRPIVPLVETRGFNPLMAVPESFTEQAILHLSLVDNNLSDNQQPLKLEMIIDSYELTPKIISDVETNLPKIFFVSASHRLPNATLAQEFDQAVVNDKADKILEMLQIIDPTIQQARTLTIGQPALHLKRKEGGFIPLGLFGTALTKVVEFAVSLLNNRGSILLIDEIENGLHYTHQADLWRMLFELARTLDVQIFATTHSIEMIQAFVEVTRCEKFAEAGAYFELGRSLRTQRIVGVGYSMDVLDFSLKRNKRVRGWAIS
jgi:AAA15 family ATPase/GTPase